MCQECFQTRGGASTEQMLLGTVAKLTQSQNSKLSRGGLSCCFFLQLGKLRL